ncbi:MAG: tetratricopeptide repeat protein [Bacteroidia bacterium]|nr:tetratricopeptide repeat protein [Bacteroidia bacterium]
MKLKYYILIILLGILMVPNTIFAQIGQDPDDDLGDVSDEYQELFFEALKQKAIENYQRAADALIKCIEIDDSQAVLFYELGKNYKQLKNFGEAEDALKEAISKEPDNEWYLDELYDVYYQQRDYDKAVKTVKQLVKYHPDYKEDLASLYLRMRRYNAALKILDELDEEQGVTFARDRMRNQIYNATGKTKDRIENLEERVENDPDKESNYLNLIYRYSESGEKEKAFETAKTLLKVNPESQLAHLALYKFYLDDNDPEKAVESMKVVLKSAKIKADSKFKVLNDFIRFVGSNPEYEDELLEATALVSESDNGKTNVEIAQYYLQKGDKEQALKYYETALKYEGDNFGIIRNILLLYIDLNQYQNAADKGIEAIDKYPAQPVLYLVSGVSLNNLNKPEKAIQVLNDGIDYIIDDNKMLSDFYQQLSTAYIKTNNNTKADQFAKKASKLLE